jgi:hypothetical protein
MCVGSWRFGSSKRCSTRIQVANSLLDYKYFSRPTRVLPLSICIIAIEQLEVRPVPSTSSQPLYYPDFLMIKIYISLVIPYLHSAYWYVLCTMHAERDRKISQCDHVATSRAMHELIGGTNR